MSGKMTERNRAIYVNGGIVIGLILCYLKGYPSKVILVDGIFLSVIANLTMYFRRKRLKREVGTKPNLPA